MIHEHLLALAVFVVALDAGLVGYLAWPLYGPRLRAWWTSLDLPWPDVLFAVTFFWVLYVLVCLVMVL